MNISSCERLNEEKRVKMPFRKLSKCHKDFVEIINKIAQVLHLENIQYIIRFSGEDIDRSHCGLFKVRLKGFRDGQQLRVKYSVIVKWQPDCEVRERVKEFYIREVIIYKDIVPKYLDIQRHFKVIEGLRIKYPNCIYTSDENTKETVAVMSLRSEGQNGYRENDRLRKIDLNHASLVKKC